MPGELKAVAGSQQMTCGVEITVSRNLNGTVDPVYGSGGTFYGTQQRTTNISSTP
jgi:hypothetical protein